MQLLNSAWDRLLDAASCQILTAVKKGFARFTLLDKGRLNTRPCAGIWENSGCNVEAPFCKGARECLNQ